MKKLLAFLLVILFLCTLPGAGVAEEISQSVHIVYAGYDGMELFGQVEIPDGVFFVRASFFLPNDLFFVIVFPISREGLFQLYIAVPCTNIAISIVDSPCALIPDHGTFYDAAPVTLI